MASPIWGLDAFFGNSRQDVPYVSRARAALTTLDPVLLGGRIKAARVAAGLTQPELAGPDASVAYLSRIESGQRRAGTELLQVLATRLGVTVEYLAYGQGWEDAGRLELQLDHAELSLVGGEAGTALELAREALGSPGLGASAAASSARGTSRRRHSTPWRPRRRRGASSGSSTTPRREHPDQGRYGAVPDLARGGPARAGHRLRPDPARRT